MFFSCIFSCAASAYKKLKHRIKENIIKNVVIQWIEFVKRMSPKEYIVYEKYGIWRYVERFKIEMMF